MWTGIIIFIITYLFIASEKIDKAIAAILGASAMVVLGVASFPAMLTKVDLNVLALLIGMMIIERVCREHGAEFGIVSIPGKGTAFQVRFPLGGKRLRMLPEPDAKD